MNARIKKLRKILNLTQKDFGKQIGMKPNSICDIEKGNCKVNERVVIAICARFNVNEKWLKTGEGDIFEILDKNSNDFFNIFSNLSPVLQEFLLKVANDLLDTQEKL